MIQYAFKKKCSERITYSEPILKKVFIGYKPRFWQRKSPENQWFSGLGGGDKRDRTADLLNAIQALSQLSYTPMFSCGFIQLGYYSNCKGICQEVFGIF